MAPPPATTSTRRAAGLPSAGDLNVNNQWAISSFQGFAGVNRRSRAPRRNRVDRVDGNDYLAVLGASRWAQSAVETGLTLIELPPHRVAAYPTSDDPSKYRPKQESDAGRWGTDRGTRI